MRKQWTYLEFRNIVYELNNGASLKEVSLKYNRSIDAIKKKINRGFVNEFSKYFNNETQLNDFIAKYKNINYDSNKLMREYNIKSKTELYNIAKKIGCRRNNVY